MSELPSVYEAIIKVRSMYFHKDRDINNQMRKEYVDSIANHWRRSANSNTDIRAGLSLF